MYKHIHILYTHLEFAFFFYLMYDHPHVGTLYIWGVCWLYDTGVMTVLKTDIKQSLFKGFGKFFLLKVCILIKVNT